MRLPRVRFTMRRLMVWVAVVALALGGVLWAARLRRRSAYYVYVAQAYDLEAKNHTTFIAFYRELAEQRRRPEFHLGQDYQDATLFTNDYGGRLTTERQGEWDPYAARLRDPDPEQDEDRLRALAVQERRRAAYFAELGTKYRRAAARPWLPVARDPPSPE
jgi:hypothetical protein